MVEEQEPGLMSEAQRFFLLSQTDSLWKEHLQVRAEKCKLLTNRVSTRWISVLQAIKFLQQAVGLRGYAAKDPLTEFKLEGYNLFVEMAAQVNI